jgi:glycine/D-amino acid oxidase-like deaminating enzyme
MQNVYDYIILGGGVSGSFTAYFLSKKGYRVLIVDPSTYMNGATVRSGGIVTRMMDNEMDMLLAKRSIELYNEVFKMDKEIFNMGYLSIERYEEAKYDITKFSRIAPDIKLLEPDEIKNRWEYIIIYKDEVGLYIPSDFTLDTILMLEKFHKILEDRGVDILKKAGRIDLRYKENTIQCIETNVDEYRAKQYVLSAGAWNKQILNSMGIEHEVFLIGIPIFKFRVDKGIKIGVWDEEIYSYWRPSGEDYWIGGVYDAFKIDHPEEGLAKPSDEHLENVLEGFMYRFRFKKWEIVDSWSGPVSISYDYRPIYGRVGNFENLYIIDGLGGRGLMRGPAISEELVKVIIEEELEDEL